MTVIGFDSTGDAFDAMGDAEEQANAGILGAQAELRDDRDHVRHWVMNPGYGYLVFGVTFSDRALLDHLVGAINPMNDDDLTDLVLEYRSRLETRVRGYLPGLAYSEVDPRGDGHDMHVSQITPISHQAFDEAKAADWQIIADTTPTLLTELLAWREYLLLAQIGVMK